MMCCRYSKTAAAFFLFIFLLLWSSGAGAAVFVVNTTDVDLPDALLANPNCDALALTPGSQCTLRAAIMQANATPGIDTIILPLDQTITLTIPAVEGGGAEVGELNITAPVEVIAVAIPADTDRLPSITQNAQFESVFLVEAGVDLVTFNGIQIINSGSPSTAASAIVGRMNSGVHINNSRFLNNTGQLISSSGSLIIENSDIRGNLTQPGFARPVIGTVGFSASLTLRNSSLTRNRASAGDGGFAIRATNSASVLIENTLIDGTPPLIGSAVSAGLLVDAADSVVVRNSTLVGFTGPALQLDSLGGGGGVELRIYNSVLDSSSNACDLIPLPSGPRELAYSYISDISCSALVSTGENLGGPLLLGPLTTEDFSVVRSRTPAFGSVLIDAGIGFDNLPNPPSQACLTTDQRGTMRPLDGDADGQPRCDIGAIETSALSSSTFVVNTFDIDAVDFNVDNGVCDIDAAQPGLQCTLRAAVMQANAKPGPDQIEILSSAATDEALNLTIGELLITEQLAINGFVAFGLPQTTLTTTTPQRFFHIDLPTGQTVSLSNLRMVGGQPDDFFGGGAIWAENGSGLTMDRVEFIGNQAAAGFGGGALRSAIPTLVSNSHFQSNTAPNAGAAILAEADLIVQRSSFYDHDAVAEFGSTIRTTGSNELTIYGSTLTYNTTGISAQGNNVRIHRTTVFDNDRHALELDASGFVSVRANVFDASTFDNCVLLSPISTGGLGDNFIQDGSCPGPGHIDGASLITPVPTRYDGELTYVHVPLVDSPLIDAVPAGSEYCSLGGTDQLGRDGAIDSDGDGTAACEMGAREILASENAELEFLINVFASDHIDTAVGDGRCDISPAAGNNCTLRAAVLEANRVPGHQTIRFGGGPESNAVLTIDDEDIGGLEALVGDLNLRGPVTVIGSDGPAESRPSVTAEFADRIFNLGNGSVEIRGLRLIGGNTGERGGAIRVSPSGDVLLERVDIRQASADEAGGAIHVSENGTLEIRESNLTANGTAGQGAAINVAGELILRRSSVTNNLDLSAGTREAILVASGGSATVSDTTVSGNNGDGIAVNGGSLSVANTTIFDNARFGLRFFDAAMENLSISRSILSENLSGSCQRVGTGATILTNRFNLFSGPESCGLAAGSSNLSGDPQLGPIQSDPSQHTAFFLPQTGSPAIDGVSTVLASNACSDLDQRLGQRPVDGDDNGTSRCDIGAIEVGAVPSGDQIFGDRFED